MTVETIISMDPARTALRTLVTNIGDQIEASAPSAGRTQLLASWSDLVKQLALGPEPEVRACPSCHSLAMRNATLCSNCWSKLVPPPIA